MGCGCVARVEDGGEVDDDGAQGWAVGGFPALAGGARVGVGVAGESREGSECLGTEGGGVDGWEGSGGLGATGEERRCELRAIEGAGNGIEQARVGPWWSGGGEGGDDGFAQKGAELLDFGKGAGGGGGAGVEGGEFVEVAGAVAFDDVERRGDGE